MNLSSKEKERFQKQSWAVFTAQEMTRNSIAEHIAEIEGAWGPRTIKYYGNEVDAYVVPFSVVEWLVKNKSQQGFDFTIYHDEVPGQDFWVKWREGRRTPVEKLKKAISSGEIRKGEKKEKKK